MPSRPTLVAALSVLIVLIVLIARAGSVAGEGRRPFDGGRRLDPFTIEPISHSGGIQAQGIAARGDFVYLGVGPQLVIVDARDASSPRRLGSVELPYPPTDVALTGDLALVADRTGGLRVIDISDPTAPREASALDVGFSIVATAAADGIAVALTSTGILCVLDLTSPENPQCAARAPGHSSGQSHKVVLVGTTAFVARSNRLDAYELLDGKAPRQVGSFEFDGTPRTLAAGGGRAFLGFGDTLWVIDADDPGAMRHIGTLEPAPAYGLAFDDDVLFGVAGAFEEADGRAGVIDLADPARPAAFPHVTVVQHAWSVTVDGGVAYAVGMGGMLQAIDARRPESPQIAFRLDLSAGTWAADRITVSDGVAYVAVDHSYHNIPQVNRLDVSDPNRPRLLGPLTDTGQAVAVDRDLAVVSDSSGRNVHLVLDVHDSAAPVELAGIGSMGIPRDAAVRGSTAYLIIDSLPLECFPDSADGLRIVDLSVPDQPQELGRLPLVTQPHRVVLAGDHALVLDAEGMKVVDISDPARPTLAASYRTLPPAGQESPFDVGGIDIAVAGDLAYLFADALHVLDLSDPTAPRLLAKAGLRGFPGEEVAIAGDLLFEATSDGLEVFDIGDPADPKHLGPYPTAYRPAGLAVVGDLLFVTHGLKGLTILRIDRTVEAPDGPWTAWLPRLGSP